MKIHQELLNLRDQERRITSKILDKLQLLQDCKGYLKMGYNSLFDYLVRVHAPAQKDHPSVSKGPPFRFKRTTVPFQKDHRSV